MPKPLRLSVDLLTYEGISPTNNPKDSTEFHRKVEEASITEAARIQKAIPASTTDLTLNLVDSSTDYLLMAIDQPVTVKLNGSGTAIALNPKAAGVKTPVLVLRATMTALTITNPSSTLVANVDFISVKI